MVLNISEILRIIRKHFIKILALSLLAGMLGALVASLTQTYTCTLGFKYNHEGAAEGLAPDGKSKLDPYELQNPLVVQGALEKMGFTGDGLFTVDGIRENITITKIYSDIDKNVSESAALLGNKYEAPSTEYQMTFTYKASLGDEFGPKMFSNLITEYDKFLLDKYYNPENIIDFAKAVNGSDADYIVLADTMNNSIENIISTLEDLSSEYPNFRSVKTGYTFSALSTMYQNLRDIEYAKFYGNIRAGNLAKDREMVIKSYQARVKELTESLAVSGAIAENYKTELSTFYGPYKEAGLYRQAKAVQENVDSSNTREHEILTDYDVQYHINTYDDIVLSYAKNAKNSAESSRTIDYYNNIINSYATDEVPQEQKDTLLAKNEIIFRNLAALSSKYSRIANETISELYNSKVNSALQYLIIPEATADKPVNLIAVFVTLLVFGAILIGIFIKVVLKDIFDAARKNEPIESREEKIEIDTSDMDDLHRLLYQQYLADFNEFYLVYQPMYATDPADPPHNEVFIRWSSPELGMVSPDKIIDCLSDFGIFKQFNAWIIGSVCRDLAAMQDKEMTLPIVHINCPHSQIDDFALNDIIIEQLSACKIAPKYLCFELNGSDIASSLEDIALLTEMGVNICIDRFEDSDESQEILRVIKPGFIKLSHNILNSDIYASSEEDTKEALELTRKYFSMVITACHENNIKACICGIENKTQDNVVTELGFDYKQGYFYGKPEKLNI